MASEKTHLEFEPLDTRGHQYHRWVLDMRQTFIGKGYLNAIEPPEGQAPLAPGRRRARALMFLRRHLDFALKWQYQQIEDPKELWDTLARRFGDIHVALLPELQAEWTTIRLMDFKSVEEYQTAMLGLRARLHFCGVEKTENDLIEKTLQTFPRDTATLMKQYRHDYRTGLTGTFDQLMTQLLTEEKECRLMLKNAARPVGTLPIPENNYNRAGGARAPRSKRDRPEPVPREQGSGGGARTRRGTRGRRSRGRSNALKNEGPPAKKGRGPQPVQRNAKEGDAPRPGDCHRCGGSDHWMKNCRAPAAVVDAYKKYKEALESHFAEMDVEPLATVYPPNFNAEDFREEPVMDAPDY